MADGGTSPPGGDVYYRFRDRAGETHVVDSLASVPPEWRETAERVVLSNAPVHKGFMAALNEHLGPGHELRIVDHLDAPSLFVGFAGGLCVALLLSLLKTTGRLMVKAGLVVLIVGFLSGAYLGWVRRSAGLAQQALADPKAILEDARRAADQARRRLEALEENMRKLERIEGMK